MTIDCSFSLSLECLESPILSPVRLRPSHSRVRSLHCCFFVRMHVSHHPAKVPDCGKCLWLLFAYLPAFLPRRKDRSGDTRFLLRPFLHDNIYRQAPSFFNTYRTRIYTFLFMKGTIHELQFQKKTSNKYRDFFYPRLSPFIQYLVANKQQQIGPRNTVYVRRVDLSALPFSFSSHRHSYIKSSLYLSLNRFIITKRVPQFRLRTQNKDVSK
jgi:hypothetical protein